MGLITFRPNILIGGLIGYHGVNACIGGVNRGNCKSGGGGVGDGSFVKKPLVTKACDVGVCRLGGERDAGPDKVGLVEGLRVK